MAGTNIDSVGYTTHDAARTREGKLTIMEEVIRELRKLGDMCVMACGEMWSAACALWCDSEEGAKRVAVWALGRPASLQGGRGPISAARLVALADLQGPQGSTVRRLATRARAAWKAARGEAVRPWRSSRLGSDDTQWLVRSRADAARARLRQAKKGMAE